MLVSQHLQVKILLLFNEKLVKMVLLFNKMHLCNYRFTNFLKVGKS